MTKEDYRKVIKGVNSPSVLAGVLTILLVLLVPAGMRMMDPKPAGTGVVMESRDSAYGTMVVRLEDETYAAVLSDNIEPGDTVELYETFAQDELTTDSASPSWWLLTVLLTALGVILWVILAVPLSKLCRHLANKTYDE